MNENNKTLEEVEELYYPYGATPPDVIRDRLVELRATSAVITWTPTKDPAQINASSVLDGYTWQQFVLLLDGLYIASIAGDRTPLSLPSPRDDYKNLRIAHLRAIRINELL